MRKLFVYFATMLLLLSLYPQSSFTSELIETEEKEIYALIVNNQAESINVYADEKGETIVDVLTNDTLVELEDNQSHEKGQKYVFINYMIDEEIKSGYIQSDYIFSVEHEGVETDFQSPEDDDISSDTTSENELDEPSENGIGAETQQQISLKGFALKQPVSVYEDRSDQSTILKNYPYGSELKYETYDNEWHIVTVYVNGERKRGYIQVTDIGETNENVTGIALKEKTKVYKDTNTKSTILRSYDKGSILKYQAYKKDWFIATVYLNGKRETGYIHIKDVETAQTLEEQLRGISIKSKTSVYEKATDKSQRLRTYEAGQVLQFRTFSKAWYKAFIIVNGERKVGYINKQDVELVNSNQENLEGVSASSVTNVYHTPSRDARVLRSYNYGHILKFRSFSNNWYEATIIRNSERTTGYIHKNDINFLNETLSGYGHKNPTVIYENKSTSSNKLKEYSYGAKLKYRPYTNNWFQATVFINDEPVTGYIKTSDVGPTYPTINGYAYGDPTVVYSSPSKGKNSKQLRKYNRGTSIKYRIYSENWYEATVFINGNATMGYIHKDDVGNTPPSFHGHGLKSPTVIYASTSRDSKRLKTYRKGSRLKYQLHSKNWYKATVIINGKSEKGYIHKNDIGKATDISFVNPMKTYTYETLVNDIKDLQKAYPDLISYHVVGKSEYGRDIYAVSLGKGKATTFINGSFHAREWVSSSLNMYMLENYAKAYKTNRKIQGYNTRSILNDTTIWFMPMINPDGVTLQQRGLNAFPQKDHAKMIQMNNGSRNFKRWKANAKGVDVNRNFSVDWHHVKNNPKGPSFQNYKGNKALSSKEAQTVVKFVNEIKPQMSVNYHSSGRVIYWQYKQRGTQLTRDRAIARQIGRMTGYQMLSAGSDPSGGGFLQWFTQTQKGPSITPELAPYAGPTNVPISRFTQIWRENQAVGLYAAQQSYSMYPKIKRYQIE